MDLGSVPNTGGIKMSENFQTYQEVDPNSKITITSSRISWTNINSNEDAYVYYDKGVDYFAADFVHLLTINISAAESGASQGAFWALTNALNDLKGIYDAAGSALYLDFVYPASPAELRISIREMDSGVLYGSSNYVLTASTVYYVKIVRDESVGTFGTLYCYVYSNAARTTLLATLSVALHTSKKDFRYVHGIITWNDTTIKQWTGYSEDLSFQATDNPDTSTTPVVTTETPTSIAPTTATGNGHIVSLGLTAVTQHGHCWATTVNPTTADSKTTNGAGSVGAFTSSITGLTAGTRYYVRAYATNTQGTGYGDGVSFISGVSGGPNLWTPGIIRITSTEFRYVGDDGKLYKVQGTAV